MAPRKVSINDEAVDTDIEKRIRAFPVVSRHRPARVGSIIRASQKVDSQNVAARALLHQTERLQHHRIHARGVADGEDAAGLLCSVDHAVAFVRRRRHRLLDKNVAPHLQSLHGQRAVGCRGSEDMDYIQTLLRQLVKTPVARAIPACFAALVARSRFESHSAATCT